MVGAADPRRRALFGRLPKIRDMVPFVALADGLPTTVTEVTQGMWVQHDEHTDSRYGGNKVRKFEHVFPVAQRRGGPILTAGGSGSHHVLATAIHAGHLGLEVEAVQYPQPETDDVADTRAALAALDNVTVTHIPNPYLMPVALAARMAALAPRRPYLLWPGASTPLGTLGYVGAGLELVAAFAAAGVDEPDDVVVPLGSGGTAVGTALGLALGGWTKAIVVAVRAADAVATNVAVLRSLEAGTAALLAVGGELGPLRHPGSAGRLVIDARWFGAGYGHPTTEGDKATARAAALGLTLDPTYTAKGFAAALDRLDRGRRVAYVHTLASRPTTTPNVVGNRE